MEDISLQIRRNKRGNDTKLSLSYKMISIIPSQGYLYQNEVFQLTHLEILDLSNNKISSIDQQFMNFKNLKMLDMSFNNVSKLEQFILKMNLSILNLSNNPLQDKFQPLLYAENQQTPKLKQILEQCLQDKNTGFGGIPQKDPFSDFDFSKKKSDPFGDVHLKKASPNWFETPMSQTMKPQKESIDSLLKKEQQRVIELENQLEQLKNQQCNNTQETQQSNDNLQSLEIDINELQFNKQIGQGGFSLVYQGEFRGTQVAIKKVFDPNITQELLDEFNNELITLAKLRHPNIVLIMGVVTKPPNLCIVTEYLQNGSLFDLLHKGGRDISKQDKLKISIQSAKAFNFLHKSKIAHRDIKSHNVLLDDNMKIKICDFGLAKNYDELNKGARQFYGTPSYMAPELFQKKAYDHKIDIFAFGALLYEIFQREVPYEGQDPQDIFKKINNNIPLTVQFDSGLNQIVQQCRQINAEDRPEFSEIISMLEML